MIIGKQLIAHEAEAKNRTIPNLKGFERPSFIERWFPSLIDNLL